MACDCVVSFIALTNQISEDFSYDSRNATIMNPRITGFVNQAITGVKNARRYSQDYSQDICHDIFFQESSVW